MTSKITPVPNGPLMVEDPPPIELAGEPAQEFPGPVALCRCGASKNKPLCDGSHKHIGFSTAKSDEPLRDRPLLYSSEQEGKRVTIAYTPVLCSHAGSCQRLASDVFNPKRDPWVEPSADRLEAIEAVMAACPSGALSLSLDDGPFAHTTGNEVTLSVEAHGPYRVANMPLEAPFNIAGASHNKYVLCRCGQSKNKPFCDGTHYDLGWHDGRRSDKA